MNRKKYLITGLILILLILIIICSIKNIITVYNYIKPPYTFITTWGKFGKEGNSDGEFYIPSSIVIDSDNNIYVSDYGNGSIQKFTPEGKFLTMWNKKFYKDSDVLGAMTIALDSDKNIYIADYYNDCILKLDCKKNSIINWGNINNLRVYDPRGIVIDGNNNIFITDFYRYLQKFTSEGKLIKEWAVFPPTSKLFSSKPDIAVDSEGNVYVVYALESIVIQLHCYIYSCIYKYDKTGTFVKKWGPGGSEDTLFFSSIHIATDLNNNIYVSVYKKNQIIKFDSDGNFITEWGREGSGDGEFKGPGDLAVDSKGNVYVIDSDNYRIQKFAPKANYK